MCSDKHRLVNALVALDSKFAEATGQPRRGHAWSLDIIAALLAGAALPVDVLVMVAVVKALPSPHGFVFGDRCEPLIDPAANAMEIIEKIDHTTRVNARPTRLAYSRGAVGGDTST